MRYILVDDDPTVLKSVKKKLDSLHKDYKLACVGQFDSAKQASSLTIDFDLLIVDYEMPVYNGIELAERIAEDKHIVFLTSTKDNERKVINSLSITGYLTKPFDLDEFETLLKKKILASNYNSIKGKQQQISLDIGKKQLFIKPEKIYYISSYYNTVNKVTPKPNNVHFYGIKDVLIYENERFKIKDLIKKLAPYNFEQINKSTIVNLHYLKKKDNHEISLYDCKETFEIGKSVSSSFINRIAKVFKY